MPAPILHLAATVLCQHGGPAQATTPFARVLVSGQPVVTTATVNLVSGCALASTSTPPCVSAQWVVGALRVMAGGTPVAVASGTAVCTPTGTGLLPVAVQTRALAS